MKVELHVTAGPAAGQHFTFEKPDCFLFGRSEDAHISLPKDPYVSRQHFLLEISPPDCKLTDLNSKNGVFVNGVRYGGKNVPSAGIRQAPDDVKEVSLEDGDEIMVGDTRIQVTIQSLPVSPVSKVESPNISAPLPNIPGYHLEQEIGQGKMGTVYKATDQKTGTSVAIKIISPRTAIEPDKIRRFEKELEILTQLRHDHIVGLFHYGQIKDRFYFIVEFVEGINLAALRQQKGGVLSLEEAAPIMFSALEGLAYAHRVKITMRTLKGETKAFRGIVHQDLKPQNILLTRRDKSWYAKISDFGLVKGFESSGFTNITSPEDVLRTPTYWPREQITHYASPVPPTDVFALAAIFYEMLTGEWVREGFRELFTSLLNSGKGPSISDYLTVILANPTIPIRRRRPDIPEPLAKVLDKALRETELPQHTTKMREILSHLRYADAAVFRNAVHQAFKEIGTLGATPVNQAVQPRKTPLQQTGIPSAGAVVYSTITPTKQEAVALLIMDLEQSTQYVLNKGDTSFSTLIGNMYRRVKIHASALELIFLKCTGDGFLLVFQTMPAAFLLAASFLEKPIHADMKIRMALHWGHVKTGPDGDVLGVEVHRVSRIESVKIQDRIEPVNLSAPFPEANRILITRQGLERLPGSYQTSFQPGGKFRLKGFEDPCELWILAGKQ